MNLSSTPAKLLVFGLLISGNSFSQTQTLLPVSEMPQSSSEMTETTQTVERTRQIKGEEGASETYQSRTTETIGTREPVDSQKQDVSAQLQEARDNLKVDEQNIQKFEAQKEEDEARIKKLEESSDLKKRRSNFN